MADEPKRGARVPGPGDVEECRHVSGRGDARNDLEEEVDARVAGRGVGQRTARPRRLLGHAATDEPYGASRVDRESAEAAAMLVLRAATGGPRSAVEVGGAMAEAALEVFWVREMN